MPKIEAPNDAERRWIAEHVARACAMARKYGGDPDSTSVPSLAALDAIWVAFSSAIREQQGDPSPLINMVGLAFGEHLAAAAELAWAVVTDEHGTEIALHGEPGELLVFPTNLVAKRWQSQEGAFLASLGSAMCGDIARLRGLRRQHGR